jgi:hypothetical protein
MQGAPVGRAAQWERLMARLEARAPALLLVAGPPGSGRTHLIDAAGRAAHELGYTVIDNGDPVAVEPTTKSSDFRRIVAALLEVADEAGRAGKGEPAGFLRQVADSLIKPGADARAVAQLLQARAPAVLLIDGYAPSAAMSGWFADVLMARLLISSAPPVVVVVADTLEAMKRLPPRAAEILELGPLDREAVASHLRATGAALQPPLTDEEVAAYCDAVAADAGVLGPLEHVLDVLGTEPS